MTDEDVIPDHHHLNRGDNKERGNLEHNPSGKARTSKISKTVDETSRMFYGDSCVGDSESRKKKSVAWQETFDSTYDQTQPSRNDCVTESIPVPDDVKRSSRDTSRPHTSFASNDWREDTSSYNFRKWREPEPLFQSEDRPVETSRKFYEKPPWKVSADPTAPHNDQHHPPTNTYLTEDNSMVTGFHSGRRRRNLHPEEDDLENMEYMRLRNRQKEGLEYEQQNRLAERNPPEPIEETDDDESDDDEEDDFGQTKNPQNGNSWSPRTPMNQNSFGHGLQMRPGSAYSTPMIPWNPPLFPYNTPPSQQPSLSQMYPVFLQAPTTNSEANIKTPTFNGKTSFQDFIVQFDSIAQSRKWSSAVKGEKLLAALGQATSILSTLPARKRTSYKYLKQALDKRFNPRLDPDLAGNVAQTRTRKRGESYVSFAQELKRLMNMAYENWPPAHVERLTRERFFGAIDDPQMRGFLWSRCPRTVEEAASMADGLEKMVNSPSTRTPTHAVYANQKGPDRALRKTGNGEKSHEDLTGKGEQGQRSPGNGQQQGPHFPPTPRPNDRPRRNGNRRRPMRPRIYQGNGGPPLTGTNQQQVAVQGGLRRGPSADDVCYYCQRPGHWSKFCPNNPHRLHDSPAAQDFGQKGGRPDDQAEN